MPNTDHSAPLAATGRCSSAAVVVTLAIYEKARRGSLTKRVHLDADGAIVSDGSACRMGAGTVRRLHISRPQELADRLNRCRHHEAFSLGCLRADLPDTVRLTVKSKLKNNATAPDDLIARSRDYITYLPGRPIYVLVDFDRKGMPAEVHTRIEAAGGLLAVLGQIIPTVSSIARVERPSTSAGISNKETGEKYPGSGGVHIYLLTADGTDAVRFLRALYERLWLAGYGWYFISAAGTLLARSPIDRNVGNPERLCFEGPPDVVPPLVQDIEARRAVAYDGDILDTAGACPSLNAAELSELQRLQQQVRNAIAAEAQKVRAAFIERRTDIIIQRNPELTRERATEIASNHAEGLLSTEVELYFVSPSLGTPANISGGIAGVATVGDILANSSRFVGEYLADPIEGVGYGRSTAVVRQDRDGTVRIYSFAHGGIDYRLQRDQQPPPAVDPDAYGQVHTRAVAAAQQNVSLGDFWAYMPMHNYIFAPLGEPWPASSVNNRLPPVKVSLANGEDKEIPPSAWLDAHKPVEQMTWAPGLPMIIRNRLLRISGWIDRYDVAGFNLYHPPAIVPGDATKADEWLKHVRRVYPADAEHILNWLAHRVQHPADKINHALVLGGPQGIGKDTMLAPVREAIGPWNFQEASPIQVLGRFNGFLKGVILRINEARDLGDSDRFAFYDHMKAYTASPPEVLRIDEKNLREYSIVNCCGVIITTNHQTDGIYLPADDRRHYVAWSDLTNADFYGSYWTDLWEWYVDGGCAHVAAWLAARDLSKFDPKAPPFKTRAFWTIADANRAPEEAELADAIDKLATDDGFDANGKQKWKLPDALTLGQLRDAAVGTDIGMWLEDRKNRRAIPHRLESCGYVPVRNPDAPTDGLWKIGPKRVAIYAKKELTLAQQVSVARRLTDSFPPRKP
jgi:hypothetical protein